LREIEAEDRVGDEGRKKEKRLRQVGCASLCFPEKGSRGEGERAGRNFQSGKRVVSAPKKRRRLDGGGGPLTLKKQDRAFRRVSNHVL